MNLRLLNTAVPLKLQFSENDARILEWDSVQHLRVQLLEKKCKVTLPSVVAFSRLFVAVGKCKNRCGKKSMQQLQDLLTHSSVAAFSRLFPSRVFFLWKLHFFLLPSCTWRWQAQRVHHGLHLLLLLSVSKFPQPNKCAKKRIKNQGQHIHSSSSYLSVSKFPQPTKLTRKIEEKEKEWKIRDCIPLLLLLLLSVSKYTGP